jgi:hypothetical protein
MNAIAWAVEMREAFDKGSACVLHVPKEAQSHVLGGHVLQEGWIEIRILRRSQPQADWGAVVETYPANPMLKTRHGAVVRHVTSGGLDHDARH